MDTTLRDGEQTSGIAFNDSEKLNIAKLLLEEVKVDRIEVASAKVSEGEFQCAKRIVDYAHKKDCLEKVEILGFIDNGQSLSWIEKAGGKVINMLTKGSLKHVTKQLRKTPEEHLIDIKKELEIAVSKGISVNVYFEDWSNSMRDSKEYTFFLMEGLKDQPIMRFMLPDTLGILNPDEAYKFCKEMMDRFPRIHFDFHAHNDYDFASANVFSAVRAGIRGIHTTVNGLGERAGNVPLSSVIAFLKDHLHEDINVDETKITKISRLVESFSGIRIPGNKPIIGENVFTQTCGVHADGDKKDNLYFNDLLPERFGRVRKYALGKTAGKANIQKNIEELGIVLDAEAIKKVTARVIELGDKKETITTEDLPYIISDVLDSEYIKNVIQIKNYALSVAYGLKPVATLSLDISGEIYEETAAGDGQYDAFMKALTSIYNRLGKKLPSLIDYEVTIPPGGHTDALVETVITWQNSKEFRTKGLDSDQTNAAIKATMRMLNLIENEDMGYSV